MVELANITNAAGLDAGAKTALEQLVEVYKKHQGTNRMLGQYYECKQPTPSIGIDNIPETVDIPTRCDWAAKAVTSVSERVRMNGFTFAEEYKDATARTAWCPLGGSRTPPSSGGRAASCCSPRSTCRARIA